MKSRKIVIVIEAKSDLPLGILRNKSAWQTTMNVAKEKSNEKDGIYKHCSINIHQVTVKVGKEDK